MPEYKDRNKREQAEEVLLKSYKIENVEGLREKIKLILRSFNNKF